MRRLIGSLLISLPLVLAAAAPTLAAEASSCATRGGTQSIPGSLDPNSADYGAVVPDGTIVGTRDNGSWACEGGTWVAADLSIVAGHIGVTVGAILAVELLILAVTAMVISGIKRDRARKAWVVPSAIVVGSHLVLSVGFGLIGLDLDASVAGVIALSIGIVAAVWYERTKPSNTAMRHHRGNPEPVPATEG